MRLKRISVLFALISMSSVAASDIDTTTRFKQFTLAKNGEIVVETGVSLAHSNFENLYYSSVSYRTPSMLFNIPTYLNLELGGLVGQGCVESACRIGSGESKTNFNTLLMGISEEYLFIDKKNFYISFSLGAYLKKPSSRIGSIFTFGERLAIGTKFSDFNLKLFARHFSNASITENNSGQNFLGISLDVPL
ncbi:acyloxyacyl hydrolase [uncultured Microbulbifer sp.]|uniref:acyloxyacyl hydrolase n=1 Tax=uncultured Microbulbifer sp. TaxID=348147 RepID=UPI00262AF170|nr:acyloxyacyl hydrolase [uncultured Microbulbifer sp.]